MPLPGKKLDRYDGDVGAEVMGLIENEYRHNIRFRRFVDRYCEENGLTVEQALERDEVKRAFWHYTEV